MHKIFIKEDEVKFNLNQNEVQQWTHNIRLELIRLADSNKNDVYETHRGRIQSALYAFEDCQSVIEDYKELEYFDVKNAAYLKLYGLLQAFFVQQDSIKNLQSLVALLIFQKAIKS